MARGHRLFTEIGPLPLPALSVARITILIAITIATSLHTRLPLRLSRANGLIARRYAVSPRHLKSRCRRADHVSLRSGGIQRFGPLITAERRVKKMAAQR